jgi:hypothetical protein
LLHGSSIVRKAIAPREVGLVSMAYFYFDFGDQNKTNILHLDGTRYTRDYYATMLVSLHLSGVLENTKTRSLEIRSYIRLATHSKIEILMSSSSFYNDQYLVLSEFRRARGKGAFGMKVQVCSTPQPALLLV